MASPAIKSSTQLSLYSRTAHLSASGIIAAYSTSFGRASRLLDRPTRNGIEDIYALVRVADELVDGAAEQAGLGPAEQRDALDLLEAEVHRAVTLGYSANLVVHAFATTARRYGIGAELVEPFFASMRRDLSPIHFTQREFDAYVYGSAEVVGLMCLHVFLGKSEANPDPELVHGARRLGAAFQKINFLRDLGTDWRELNRSYFPGVDVAQFSEDQKLAIVADIESDLNQAAAVIGSLPRRCRVAVTTAHLLFAELTRRIKETPAEELLTTRIRVPTIVKAQILARARWGRRPQPDRAGAEK
jgi:15-cis-phytoene synthase